MRTIKSINSLKRELKIIKSKNQTIGFVPTMGAFHKGHLSLMRNARRDNDIVIVSIFVNPTQFGPKEDFEKYPRQIKIDELFAKKEKVDIIFYPSAKEIYKDCHLTYVNVTNISKVLCGRSRPNHFEGVTTIVSKLINITEPDVMYLGQKDAQQAVIIKTMVKDLNFNVAIKICPIVREKDGLAMSSRNSYLSQKHRQEAPCLYKSLKEAKKMILAGNTNSKSILSWVASNIKNNSSGIIDYTECINADTLMPISRIKGRAMIALAVKFRKTRLIDNILFHLK
ncbi:MAG: pantoate--beta-alanine ligase [Candidatus Omnitrophica bacterium]|nr:pantoate--beta-alanine ligase [Candidatus Omnitrophota bacterium]MBU1995869.1 pantoate--beta-alanine ligase [Candidatus Omnitrophota bacterium]